MTLFSGSTILWSILGEYEPFNPTCSGLFSAVRDVRGGQFGSPIDIWEENE